MSETIKTRGVLGEKTFQLLRRIPVETIEVDEQDRVVLRLLRHIDKSDATNLFWALDQTLKQDRVTEKQEAKES